MNKPKLTTQQSLRVKRQQEKLTRQVKDAKHDQHAVQHGQVISRFGKTCLIKNNNSELIRCHIRRNITSPVCGDQIVWQQDEHTGEASIVAVQERSSELVRPDKNGHKRIIAANINQLLIVVAAKPALNEGLVDRYLAAAEISQIKPVIVFNKVDLLDDEQRSEYEKRLQIYSRIGYTILMVSSKQSQGMEQLFTLLNDRISIVVGQSGVGKSSLVNALLPEANAQIATISESTSKGKHTTTTARLYDLPCSGALIDSPGVREFGLWEISTEQLATGFREFHDYAQQCKFRNCLHVNEPGCAVQQAAKQNAIDPLRLQSYLRILDSLQTG